MCGDGGVSGSAGARAESPETGRTELARDGKRSESKKKKKIEKIGFFFKNVRKKARCTETTTAEEKSDGLTGRTDDVRWRLACVCVYNTGIYIYIPRVSHEDSSVEQAENDRRTDVSRRF